MLDDQSPEYDGSAQSENVTPNQKMLVSLFGYFNKVSCTVAQENIKIKIEKPNGMKTYLRKKQEIEEIEEKILSTEELIALQDETMYNIELVPAGNSTEILRTLLRFVTSNEAFHKQMEECVKEAFTVANKKATSDRFLKTATEGGGN